MAVNPATIVEEVLGEALAPELVIAVQRKLPRERLVELHDRYTNFCADFRLPQKDLAALRPYISHPVAQSLGLDDLYLNPNFSSQRSEADNVLKQHLLFAHELVMHDPLPYHLDFFEDSKARLDDAPHRARLAQYLGFLMQVRPLLDAGVLFFIDDAPYRMPWLEQHRSWPPQVPELDALREHATAATLRDIEGVKSTLVASSFHQGNLDLYVSGRDSLRALGARPGDLGKSARVDQIAILQRLMAIDLPAVDDLSLHDVVRLRQDEALLERWRVSISCALTRLVGLEQTVGPVTDEDVRRSVSTELNATIGRDLRAATFGSVTKGVVRTFTITAVAALAVSGTYEPEAAIARAATAGALGLFLQFVLGGVRTTTGLYLRHVAVFE